MTGAPEAPSSPAACAAPAGMGGEAVQALEEVNRLRRAAGLSCVELVPQMVLAAERHCRYFVGNKGQCTAKPHREVAGCAHFSGETFGERLRAASYPGHPAYEVMAYVGKGQTAVNRWVDSVWHRIPVLSPRVDQMGYGAVGRCDTMDFGASGRVTPSPQFVLFPYDGQAGVPTRFDGLESPEPPRPPQGWPSGYPITVYAPGLTVTQHTIAVEGSGPPIDHIWLSPGDPRAEGLLFDEHMMYTWRPLARNTTYRVTVVGEQNGTPVRLSWTFTTGKR